MKKEAVEKTKKRGPRGGKLRGDKEVLFVYMRPDIKDFMRKHAQSHNLSLTQLVEAVITKYVKNAQETLVL